MKKTILLCISSSIAAYKILELIKLLKKEFNLNVIVTKNALNLIPLKEFEHEAILHTELFSENKTYKDYFNDVEHINLAKADLVVIATATANVIGKIAHGIADDLLTTTVMASTCPKLIAPAMNTAMYNNQIVQENILKLKQHGFRFMGPSTGHLACGSSGIGRLVEIHALYNEIKSHFRKQYLAGKKVLITAGPTIERIDPVRYVSNFSSGKMGIELVKAAQSLGAEVTLIACSGVNRDIKLPSIKTICIESAEQMRREVMKCASQMDIIVMAAAVADFKPVYSKEKIKRKGKLVLELQPTPDILAELGKQKKKNQIIVGFALETNNVIQNARKKFKEKNVDLLVVNSPTSIGSDESKVIILNKDGKEKLPMMSKEGIADKIFEIIKKMGLERFELSTSR